MKIRQLKTHAEVIDALGGNIPFARLVSTRKKPRNNVHVSNYRNQRFFPSDTFLVVADALQRINCSAPPSLWNMVEPKTDAPKREAS